ncbi:uncharacterized protein LOC142760592 isoform X2 [Rhinoderma darwinii]|uniref:uncharacterized protein LOC142760592 isoform X2 n=1 Tax=Rhinoderma darwinii TaxID=43563 RepID=UPI003F67FE92
MKTSCTAEVTYVCPPFDPATCMFSKPGPAECHRDSECPRSMKCCCSNCGWKCVVPVEVKNGRCPQILVKCRPPALKPRCQKDSDCPKLRKCCNICGKSCWDPAPEPEGNCPRNDGKKLRELQCSSVQCNKDSDCSGYEKCCVSGDEQKCVEPVRPGQCPMRRKKCLVYYSEPQCQRDSDCPELQKCCDICGKSCWDAVPDE